MASTLGRMIRAAKLETRLYEEVEADSGATGQAMLVVVVSSVAAGIGLSGAGVSGLFGGVIAALIGWFIWAFLTYVIGTRLLPSPRTEADRGQLLRTTGFSSSPGVIRVLGIVPFLGPIVVFVVSIWMLIAMIIAVRQALDYDSTGRAILVCIIGWLVQMVIVGVAGAILGGFGILQ